MQGQWTGLLVCPFCKGKLRFYSNLDKSEFWCLYEGIAFPCYGTTPIFLESSTRTLSAEEKLNSSRR